MDGRKFRYHDNHEFFHSATTVKRNAPSLPGKLAVAHKLTPKWRTGYSARRPFRWASPPLPGGKRSPASLAIPSATFWRSKRPCTRIEATRPRRLDPALVSVWIYAHPAFRMREVYECRPKDVIQGQGLLEF